MRENTEGDVMSTYHIWLLRAKCLSMCSEDLPNEEIDRMENEGFVRVDSFQARDRVAAESYFTLWCSTHLHAICPVD